MDLVLTIGVGSSYVELGVRRKLGFYICCMKRLCTFGFDKAQGFYHRKFDDYNEE